LRKINVTSPDTVHPALAAIGGIALRERMMSFGEKIYLVGILFVFASFIAMMGTLSWLDVRDERIKRRREGARQASPVKHEALATGAAVHR
jgi:hypothetical protein